MNGSGGVNKCFKIRQQGAGRIRNSDPNFMVVFNVTIFHVPLE